MQAKASASPDAEICGLLFGTTERIDWFEPAPNIAAHPRDSFEIDPQALFAAVRSERLGGPALTGYYHSHPSGAAIPSSRDEAMALDRERLWLIIGADGLKLWRVCAPGVFEAVELALESDGPERQ